MKPYADRSQLYAVARQRALGRLAKKHPRIYRRFYEEAVADLIADGRMPPMKKRGRKPR